MPRIAIGQFMQESHSFTSIACSWEQFRAGHIYRGAEIVSKTRGNSVELAGALDMAESLEIDFVALLACNAVSSGYIEAAVFDELLAEMLQRLRTALPVDGVFLALHGAMVAEGDEDASGTVLAAVRGLVGPGVTIVASLDLHANVTEKMIKSSDGLIGYHTCPHVDLYETGSQCMQLLIDTIRGIAKPAMVRCQRRFKIEPFLQLCLIIKHCSHLARTKQVPKKYRIYHVCAHLCTALSNPYVLELCNRCMPCQKCYAPSSIRSTIPTSETLPLILQ